MLFSRSRILVKAICPTIQPENRVPIDLLLLFAHDHSTKIYGPLSFNLSFVHNLFDQKPRSSLIFFFYVQTNIRPKYMILFHLFFLLCTTFRPRLRVLTDLFLLIHTTTIWQEYVVLIHLFFLLCTTIWPKTMSFIDLFLLFAHDHSTKIYEPLSFILYLCRTIRPKIRVQIDLFLLFLHEHLTKN